MAVLIALLALLPPSQAVASDILGGRARVIDADMLEIAGRRVRLDGLDAPGP